jgi:glycosyltransferase involved in cell wall biosynthesis
MCNKEMLLFLSWGSPWPATAGGSLRTLGLLKELSRYYPVDMLILSENPLSNGQEKELLQFAKSIVRVPLLELSLLNYLRIFQYMLVRKVPYHCALLNLSLQQFPDYLKQIRYFPGLVYASYGHWGSIVRGQDASNWILDQHNADVDFWRVYATQSTSKHLQLAAQVNWRLAKIHFPLVYSSVGRVVSVCEADRQLTLDLAPRANIAVVENGVDCSYYAPKPEAQPDLPRLLFTGTSAPRNVTALRYFVEEVWPIVRKTLPDAELLVAGNFKPRAQLEFKSCDNLRFTGWVEDIRPYFNQSDVFIAPFEVTHGSKLKIAEAMAMGMPIVSTPEGIRGFDLVDGESVLVARNRIQFASQIVDLMHHPEWREHLGASARKVALTTIDWKILGRRLKAIVEEVQSNLRR